MRNSKENVDNYNKEQVTASIEGTSYTLTIVNHFQDGKTIIYRRFKTPRSKSFKPFDPTRLSERKRVILGISLLLEKWDIGYVALFLGRSIGATKEELQV